jgi:hypothetical protein
MRVVRFLEENSEKVIDRAMEAVRRTKMSGNGGDSAAQTRHRLESMYTLAKQCLRIRNAELMVRRADEIARERFYAGYDLGEVQLAFNVLEESIWKEILQGMEPGEYAEAIGSVSAILGLGKDALARTYVSLASRERVPTLDLKRLFKGGEGNAIPESTGW